MYCFFDIQTNNYTNKTKKQATQLSCLLYNVTKYVVQMPDKYHSAVK